MTQKETPHQKIIKKGVVFWNRWAVTVMKKENIASLSLTEKEILILNSTPPLSEEELKVLGLELKLDDLTSLNRKIILRDFPVSFKSYRTDTPPPKGDFLFPFDVIFEDIECENVIYLYGSIFCKNVMFEKVVFNSTLDLSNSKFLASINFKDVDFNLHAYFKSTVFNGLVHFTSVNFKGAVNFNDATFSNRLFFTIVEFNNEVQFVDCKFSGRANFSGVIFNGKAFFNDSKFIKEADFYDAKFNNESASFINTSFGLTTSFNKVLFNKPPHFHNAELHQDTSFSGAKYTSIDTRNFILLFIYNIYLILFQVLKTPYSKLKLIKSNIKNHFSKHKMNHGFLGLLGELMYYIAHPTVTIENKDSRAWRTLKLAMNKVHNREQELVFYANEMDARRRELLKQGRIAAPILLSFYSFLSDYGRSLWRPFFHILVLWFIFSGIYHHEWIGYSENFFSDKSLRSIMLSTANTIPFVPYSKTMIAASIGKSSVNIWFQLTMILQNIFSTLLWFLVGLALRNQFTLK